ncbi:MAG: LemA family protein [Bdellovibrionaceae bacterium]|nr:LemA family protein [Pseudobdellovibrionaceae bacterium]
MNPLVGIAILVFIGIFLILGLNVYNALVRLRNQLERAWANIDVILKQRSDEIPNLVQVIEQYAGYEAGLLQKLADARSNYGRAQNVDEKIRSSNEMALALSGVFAIGEAYPELKANENFNTLQQRISQLETTLADRREVYNETVANFNTRLDQFPDVIAARILNYQRQTMFQVSEAEKQMPNLKMNLPKFGN